MFDKIKRLLKLEDENGNLIFTPQEVRDFTGLSLNAVYADRDNKRRHYRLLAFEKIKEAVEELEKKLISISGDKDGLLSGLDNLLKDGKKYEIYIKEVE